MFRRLIGKRWQGGRNYFCSPFAMLPIREVFHSEVSMTHSSQSPGFLQSSRHQRGVTSIEYALMATVIAMAILVGVGAVGQGTFGLWTSVVTKVLAALGVTA